MRIWGWAWLSSALYGAGESELGIYAGGLPGTAIFASSTSCRFDDWLALSDPLIVSWSRIHFTRGLTARVRHHDERDKP